MEIVKFPNIDLVLNLKVRSVCKKDKITTYCAGYYKPVELYKLLKCPTIDIHELGGEYHVKNGFTIDPRVSFFDTDEDRPYTTLNKSSNSGVFWHSHPFVHEFTSYPSIEDLDMFRMNPQLIFLIISRKGIYVISVLKPYTSIDTIVSFYREMQPNAESCNWDYNDLELSFSQNKCFSENIIKDYGLFVKLIPPRNICTATLNNTIISAYSKKDKVLKTNDSLNRLVFKSENRHLTIHK